MKHLTVICVNVGTKYQPNYVTKLRNMVSRNLKIPHDFVCMTDNPKIHDGVDCIPLPDPTLEGWWSKINLFRQDLSISGPMLYLDLDIVITNPLDDLILGCKEDFTIIRQWKKNIRPQTKYGITKPLYNSSAMFWRESGCRSEVAKRLTPKDVQKWRGDQDWIAVCLPNAETFPDQYFCCYEDLGPAGLVKRTWVKIVLFSKLENHFIAPKVKWVRDMWG